MAKRIIKYKDLVHVSGYARRHARKGVRRVALPAKRVLKFKNLVRVGRHVRSKPRR